MPSFATRHPALFLILESQSILDVRLSLGAFEPVESSSFFGLGESALFRRTTAARMTTIEIDAIDTATGAIGAGVGAVVIRKGAGPVTVRYAMASCPLTA